MNSKNKILFYEYNVIGIIIGSKSDWKVIKNSIGLFLYFKIPYEINIVSAHRSPYNMINYASYAKKRFLKNIMAGAGGSAHLPGMTSSFSSLPVSGVPIKSNYFNGLDSFFSIIQMPKGISVASFSIGKSGSINSSINIIYNLSNLYIKLYNKLLLFRKYQNNKSKNNYFYEIK